jgi:hypothetical protein
VFTEQGNEAGEVRLENGKLVGPRLWVQWVERTMEQRSLDAEAAFHRLDGWTNGYLTLKLHRD